MTCIKGFKIRTPIQTNSMPFVLKGGMRSSQHADRTRPGATSPSGPSGAALATGARGKRTVPNRPAIPPMHDRKSPTKGTNDLHFTTRIGKTTKKIENIEASDLRTI